MSRYLQQKNHQNSEEPQRPEKSAKASGSEERLPKHRSLDSWIQELELPLRQALRKSHRKAIEEAAQKAWKLAQRAKNRQKPFKPSTPFLRKLDGSMALTKEDRAQCLVESFFPPPAAANLQYIADTSYPEPISLPPITEEEILQAVTNAAPNKALGEDGILNHIIKIGLPTIMPALAWVFNSSIMAGYCPKHFRESITVMLRKPNKPD